MVGEVCGCCLTASNLLALCETCCTGKFCAISCIQQHQQNSCNPDGPPDTFGLIRSKDAFVEKLLASPRLTSILSLLDPYTPSHAFEVSCEVYRVQGADGHPPKWVMIDQLRSSALENVELQDPALEPGHPTGTGLTVAKFKLSFRRSVNEEGTVRYEEEGSMRVVCVSMQTAELRRCTVERLRMGERRSKQQHISDLVVEFNVLESIDD